MSIKTVSRNLLFGALLAASTQQAIAVNVIAEVSLNERLYPSATNIFSTTVDLDSAQDITAVGLLTDWWQKRPTEVRVYDNSTGTKGSLLGSTEFFSYDNSICGSDYSSTCKYPDNSVGRLMVDVSGTVSSVVVEAHGLLSSANGFAQINGVQVLNGTSSTSNASDSLLAIIAVLENEELQSISGTSAYVNSVDVGVNSDFSKYLIDVNYQIIDSPTKRCIRSEVDYQDYPTGNAKSAEVTGTDC